METQTKEFIERSKSLTQSYSTMGNKLLTNTELLANIQQNKKFTPNTVQLAPCEICSSSCPFCSVGFRPLKSYLSFPKIEKALTDFRSLSAKALEISGGGQPDLYYDKENKKDINDIIECASGLGYKIGIISNTNDLARIKPRNFDKIEWIRISLIKLEEGVKPEDYNFRGFPYEKLAFSYIIYRQTEASPSTRQVPLTYKPTSRESIERIASLVDLHPQIKFVRLVPDCLVKNGLKQAIDEYSEMVNAIDKYKKFFIRDSEFGDNPFEDGCYTGAIRPYISAHPDGTGPYQVYICTSYVLQKRNYDLDYSLGNVEDILQIWERMNSNFKNNGYPYEVNGNKGCGWGKTCKFCYYHANNEILHTVAHADKIPNRDFI